LVDALLVVQQVVVHLDLNRQDLHRVSGDFELVGLAVELDAVDRLKLLSIPVSLRRSNKGKLDIAVEVAGQVLERKFEFLHAVGLAHGKRDNLLTAGLVDELLDTLNARVIKEAEQKNLDLRRFLDHWLGLFVRDVLLFTACQLVGESDVDEADDARLQAVLRCLYDDDELLIALCGQSYFKLLLEFLAVRVLDKPAVVLEFAVFDKRAVLVVERKLLTVVWAEDVVAVVVRRA